MFWLRTSVRIRPSYGLFQIRHIRTKTLSKTLLSLNDSINSQKKATADEDINKLKKQGFVEVDVKSGINEWFLTYLSMTNSGFKKSRKNLSKLQRQKDVTITDVVAYLLTESENELKRIHSMKPEDVERFFNESKDKEIIRQGESVENLDDTILKEIVYEEAKKNFQPLANTEQLLTLLAKTLQDDTVEKTDVLSLDQMVEAFELAKLIPNKEYRLRGQYLAGQLIYGLKKVRLDPGNESFYIDSLLFFGKYNIAAGLFESYKARVNERWWYEVGMMIYLRGNKFHKFDHLYQETKTKFGDNYVRPNVLILAIRKHLLIRDLASAKKLTNHLISIIRVYGWSDETQFNTNKTLNFESSEDANDFLNEVQGVSRKDYLNIISYYLSQNFKKEALTLFVQYEEFTQMDQTTFNELIIKLRLQWLKTFDSFGDELKPYLTGNNPEEKIEQLRRWFNESMVQNNFHEVRQSFDYLLYDNLKELVQNKRISKTLQRYIVDMWITDSADQSNDFKSKKMQAIIKVLLVGYHEKAALDLLEKLEQSSRNTLNKDSNSSNVYPPVNAHHYATFINHYMAQKSKLQSKKIESMFKRAQENSVEINTVLVEASLKYLTRTKKYEDCILLINSLFASNKEILSPLYSSENLNNLTRSLYLTIWAFYSAYYNLIRRTVERTDSCGKSKNSDLSTIYMRNKIESSLDKKMFDVFCKMVIDDGIIINDTLAKKLIRAFCSNREWTHLICVLTYMRNEQKIEISDDSLKYILNGLRKDYLDKITKKLQKPHTTISEKEQLEHRSEMIENDSILNTCFEDNYETLIYNLLEYLSLVHYDIRLIEKKLDILGLDRACIEYLYPQSFRNL